MQLRYDEVPSPIGVITLTTTSDALCALDFGDCEERTRALLRSRFGPFTLTRSRDPLGCSSKVKAYLRGQLDALEDVRVEMRGTPFQEQVWSALRRVKRGTTCSYADLASAIGRPSATRAVGATNGRNPIALVIPCHRVIGADGSLTGYAGGVERKQWLLRHEGALLS